MLRKYATIDHQHLGEIMKSYRIDVNGMDQFEAAQKALFAMGYGWIAGGKEVMNYERVASIYADEHGNMIYTRVPAPQGIGKESLLVFAADGVSLVEPEPVQLALPLEPTEAVVVAQPSFHAPVRQIALSRGSDPSTSKAAGMSFDPTMLELEVLGAIRSFGIDGATQDDVLTKLRRISHSSITPRFRPLLNKGLVIDSGLKRKGVSGRGQRVMVAA
jgi:hypothetical protein